MIEMRSLTALVLALTIAGSAHGEAINFGPGLAASGWSVVTFPGVAPASFKANGVSAIEVAADAAAGLLWRAVKEQKFRHQGDKPRGSMLPSPHMGQRGKFIVLRPADAPRRRWLNESVDLVSDHVRAFGQMPSLLLAVAISSDSDDTRGLNRARLRDLRMGD